jgi:hypothetical protein
METISANSMRLPKDPPERKGRPQLPKERPRRRRKPVNIGVPKVADERGEVLVLTYLFFIEILVVSNGQRSLLANSTLFRLMRPEAGRRATRGCPGATDHC